MDEFDLIDVLLADEPALPPWVRTGPGDDAAVLSSSPGCDWVLSTDTLVEGRHFPEGMPPDLLGFRALAVNLSDLAAMGAEPSGFLVALVAPGLDRPWCRRFSAGLRAAAGDCGARLVGGNLAKGPLAVTVTVTGNVPAGEALLRSGARSGDGVWLSGRIGAGRVAREHLEQSAGALPNLDLDTVPPDWRAYLLPSARVALGLGLRGRATACIDVSDGLIADLGHLCKASGVAAEIRLDALPVLGDARTAAVAGDDYELLFTLPGGADVSDLATAATPLTPIGRIGSGQGVRLLAADGSEVAMPDGGWDHFR